LKTKINLKPNMKHAALALIACICALACVPAHADSACNKPKNDFDSMYCLNKIYQESDKALNAEYKKQVAKLDAAGKAALKTEQLAWIEQRNSSCSKTDASGFYINLACATQTTALRTQALQNRRPQ
jgi:uncharacterized protein YecT (DUF1311 family)